MFRDGQRGGVLLSSRGSARRFLSQWFRIPVDTPNVAPRGLQSSVVARRSRPVACRWCGREVPDSGIGRRRQSCRQRAYEQRAMVKGSSVPPDSVVLSLDEAGELSDRVYQVRCAAEDVATAVAEGADSGELTSLCDALLAAVKAADGWR